MRGEGQGGYLTWVCSDRGVCEGRRSSAVDLTAGVVFVTALILDVVVPFKCCLVNRGGGGHCGHAVNIGTFFFFNTFTVTSVVVLTKPTGMRTTRATTTSNTALTANVKCLTTTLIANLSYVNNNVTITDTTDTTLKTVDRSSDILNGSLVFMKLTRNIYLCKLVVSFVVLKGLWFLVFGEGRPPVGVCLVDSGISACAKVHLTNMSKIIIRRQSRLGGTLRGILSSPAINVILLARGFNRRFPSVVSAFQLRQGVPLLVRVPSHRKANHRGSFVASCVARTVKLGLWARLCCRLGRKFLLALRRGVTRLRTASVRRTHLRKGIVVSARRTTLRGIFRSRGTRTAERSRAHVGTRTTGTGLSLGRTLTGSRLRVGHHRDGVRRRLGSGVFRRTSTLVSRFVGARTCSSFLVGYVHGTISFTKGSRLAVCVGPASRGGHSSLRSAAEIRLAVDARSFQNNIHTIVHSHGVLVSGSFDARLGRRCSGFMFLKNSNVTWSDRGLQRR